MLKYVVTHYLEKMSRTFSLWQALIWIDKHLSREEIISLVIPTINPLDTAAVDILFIKSLICQRFNWTNRKSILPCTFILRIDLSINGIRQMYDIFYTSKRENCCKGSLMHVLNGLYMWQPLIYQLLGGGWNWKCLSESTPYKNWLVELTIN